MFYLGGDDLEPVKLIKVKSALGDNEPQVVIMVRHFYPTDRFTVRKVAITEVNWDKLQTHEYQVSNIENLQKSGYISMEAVAPI